MDKRQKIEIYALRHEHDSEWCSKQCFFFERGGCRLFSENLEEGRLPEGHIWQNKDDPEYERCLMCKMMDL